VDEDLLGGFRLGGFARPFDEFAVETARFGTRPRAGCGTLTTHWSFWADWMSLNVVASQSQLLRVVDRGA
jgi:hypothetical protein